ncbi:MAG: HupE/UreJ family protein [Nitrospira sp.]
MNLKKLKVAAGMLMLILIPVLALAHGISEADKQAMIDGGYLQYVWLGGSHMLTGYDHLLFIFGVIFFLTGFRDIVKYITIFTLGHSLTLVFATIFSISANYHLVDAVIALSVCYKGFDNLDGFKKYLKMSSPNLLWVIFIFGLIHGFGLSTRLQQLPLGESGLIFRILSFNVGVELGQITALTIMLSLIITWRRFNSFKQFSTVSNAGLIVAGAFLFLMQIHGYGHTTDPDSFGFSTDNHIHEHQQMEEEIITQQRNSRDSIF